MRMASLDDLCVALDGLEIAYSVTPYDSALHGGEAPDIPHIVLMPQDSGADFADNREFESWENWDIELYTDFRDFELEGQLKDALDALDLAHPYTYTYISDEKLHLVTYSVELDI
jgi:hypothetical protein